MPLVLVRKRKEGGRRGWRGREGETEKETRSRPGAERPQRCCRVPGLAAALPSGTWACIPAPWLLAVTQGLSLLLFKRG